MESDVFNSANAVARLLDAWNPCIYALAKLLVSIPEGERVKGEPSLSANIISPELFLTGQLCRNRIAINSH